MIKIYKGTIPDILSKNQEKWTNDLMDAINKYNGYSNIQKNEKEKLLIHYHHKEIKIALFNCSFHKCAYCESKEESGYLEIEHFFPKSIYPKLTFNWNNLLPSCKRCNIAKGNEDVKNIPIINPTTEDPEKLLKYISLKIVPAGNNDIDIKKAKNTIEICNLNCHRLYQARSLLLVAMENYIDELKIEIEKFYNSDNNKTKKKYINRLSNSIDKVEELLKDSSNYAGYCRWFMNNCIYYLKAKQLLEESICT